MPINNQTENIVFSSPDELLNSDITFMSELGKDVYVRINTGDPYYNAIWKYDRKAGRVSWMMYTEYILTVADRAVEVDPKLWKDKLKEV